MQTKWGKTAISNGYYIIGGNEKGYKNKKLHRLIWEEVNGPIPKGYFIHHKDENRMNNDIENLEIMSHAEP
ncbi:MAG: HNH endonuclease [Methanobrevibacter sp.]|jgi:hypothetical protein|nr:HNH endonuclease [Methanobrevibacter sp.]